MSLIIKCAIGLLFIWGTSQILSKPKYDPCPGSVRSVQVQTEDERLTPPGMPATIHYDEEGNELCKLHGQKPEQLNTSV